MGGIALDQAILISMILESLLHGNPPKHSCSITNKISSGIFTVMFGFTLWVLIHERRGRVNMRLLLPALVLYTLATAVSQPMVESIYAWNNSSYAWLRQAFNHRRISECEGFHHIPRCTRWPYCLPRQFIECKLPPQIFVLHSSNPNG